MCVAHMGGRLPFGSGLLGHWYCSMLVGWGVVYAIARIQDLVGSHWPNCLKLPALPKFSSGDRDDVDSLKRWLAKLEKCSPLYSFGKP